MKSKIESKMSMYIQIIVLGVAGGSIYLLPYIRYTFYDWQIAAMGISNTQLGLLTSIYTIGNTILYIPGGILADKFSTKKCIFISLLSTTIVTFIFALNVKSYSLALVIYLLLSLTTNFVFWGSLMKAVRLIGNSSNQGFMYGLYYMCNGLMGGIADSIGLKVTGLSQDATGKFVSVVVVYGIITAVASLLVWFLLKDKKKEFESLKTNEFKIDQVGSLLKNPSVWIFSIIVFTGYTVYSSTSYFTPYLTDIVGITPEESAFIAIIRNYGFYFLAPLSGVIADKVFKSTSKWFMFLFAISAVLFAGVLAIPSSTSVAMVSIYTMLPALFGIALYSLLFSIATETKIPVAVMATAVGIASIIGYFPDFFIATMYGHWLDKFGSAGYNYVFMFVAVNSIIGFIATLIVRKRLKATQILSKENE